MSKRRKLKTIHICKFVCPDGLFETIRYYSFDCTQRTGEVKSVSVTMRIILCADVTRDGDRDYSTLTAIEGIGALLLYFFFVYNDSLKKLTRKTREFLY